MLDIIVQRSSGCLGCYERPTFNPSVNESSKGLRVQGEAGKKASISEGFWTTSTCDMDNSAVQSQGSISSISTSNQTLDPHGSVASTNTPAEFAFFSGIKFGSAGWETGSLEIGSESFSAFIAAMMNGACIIFERLSVRIKHSDFSKIRMLFLIEPVYKLERDLRKFTWKQQAIPSAYSSFCKFQHQQAHGIMNCLLI
ncbi:hypothetical protein V6N13_016052 [Hibiscus sabdariffa]